MLENHSREAIILAGGLGTRLRGVIGEMPKCMAPVNGLPFLQYLLRYLLQHDIRRVVLSLGYQSTMILDWLDVNRSALSIDFMTERKPLGTGGGISLAMQKCAGSDVFVLNGDTMFDIDPAAMMEQHISKGSLTTLALKHMPDASRYGTVRLNDSGCITSFEEKATGSGGWINGGMYIINRKSFLEKDFPEAYSFEKDYLGRFVDQGEFYGFMSDAYFIDIGVPADYLKAQSDFQRLFPA